MNKLELLRQTINYCKKDKRTVRGKKNENVCKVNFDSLHTAVLKDINNYVEYDNSGYMIHTGVYLIEDFYIGQSHNLPSRIASHIIECFYKEYQFDGYVNEEKCKKILEILAKNKKIKVKLLTDNVSNEARLIKEYFANGTNLVNKTHLKYKI